MRGQMLVIRKQLDLSASGGVESHGVSGEQHFHRWDSISSNVFLSSDRRSAARVDEGSGIGARGPKACAACAAYAARMKRALRESRHERRERTWTGMFRSLRVGTGRAPSRQSGAGCSTGSGPWAAHAAAGRACLCCCRARRIETTNSTCANMFEMLRSVRTAGRRRSSALSSRPGLRRAYSLLAAGHILAPNPHDERAAAEVARIQYVPSQTSQEASPMPDCIVSHQPFLSYAGRANLAGACSRLRPGWAAACLALTRVGQAGRTGEAGTRVRYGNAACNVAGASIRGASPTTGAGR
jgi:hypothetical protein